MPNISVTKIASLAGHIGSVYTLLQDTGEPHLFYSASGDGKIIRWNLKDLPNGLLVAQVNSNIFSMLLLPQQNKMLLGQMQGGIHVLDLKENKEVKHLAYHQQGVFDLLYVPERRLVLAAGGDGVLSVWNDDFSLKQSFQISPKSIRQIAFHPSKKILALGCSDTTAYVIQAEDFGIAHRLPEHESSVFSVCFSADGRYLLTGSRDAHLRIWDAEDDFRLFKKIPAHLFTINCIACSPDGKLFATASRDKSIKIWDAQNFDLLKVIDKEKMHGHINSVNKLLWTNYDNLLVSCSDDRSVMVWRVE